MPDEEVPRTGLPIEDFEGIADLNCRPLKYVLDADAHGGTRKGNNASLGSVNGYEHS